MAALWSDEGKLSSWLEVELAALEAWAELGAIPPEDAQKIVATAKTPDPEHVREIEATLHHDTAAFIDAVCEQLGDEGRWFHYGLTSSDVVDTALSLQIGRAGALILEGLERALAAVVARAREHRRTVCIGRTHGVHAEPTSFGLKLAVWAFELERDRDRLKRALGQLRVGKFSGVVGTYAATDPRLEEIACKRLGLEPAPASTQIIQRDRHAELLSTLALCASSLDKFALEIRHLARTEVREVQEPFGKGQKGSSAMPHKRNPVLSENLTGLARIVRSAVVPALEDVALWHERDISHSSVERMIGPDATVTLDFALARLADVIDKLLVYPANMRKNLDRLGGLIHSQRVLLALTQKRVSREDAYALVQRNAMPVWRGEGEFLALLKADKDVANALSAAELESLFDLGYHLKHVDTIFTRVFGRA